jgi:hypothetical protein
LPKERVVLFATKEGRQLVERKCRQAHIPSEVLYDLVDAELEQLGKQRRRGLFPRIEELLDGLAGSDDEK